jgi:hypothetical protein
MSESYTFKQMEVNGSVYPANTVTLAVDRDVSVNAVYEQTSAPAPQTQQNNVPIIIVLAVVAMAAL